MFPQHFEALNINSIIHSPLSDMYPMQFAPKFPQSYPRPYPAYMASRPTKITAFPYTLNKDEQEAVEKPTEIDYMDTSRRLRRNGDIVMAALCENRHLCEMGLNATRENDPNKSAHTIYKSLWRISNGFEPIAMCTLVHFAFVRCNQ